MKTVVIEENDDAFVAGNDLKQEDAARLGELLKGHGQVRPALRGEVAGWIVRAEGCVGMVGVGHRLQLVVTPKVPIDNLLALVEWTQELRLLDQAVPPVRAEQRDFLIRWLELYVRQVARITAVGLRKTYVEAIRPALPIRGRILVGETMRRPGRVDPVCRLVEHTLDNPHNRLLYAALDRARAVALPGSELAKAVQKQVTVFQHQVRLLRPRQALDGRDRTPLGPSYDLAESMARTILAGAALEMNAGSTLGAGLLLETDVLFEESVFRILHHLLPEGLYPTWGEKHPFSQNPGMLPMSLDIVIRSRADGHARVVLDCKYKSSAKHADCYQVVSYSKHLDCAKAALVYPMLTPTDPSGVFGNVAPIELHRLTLDLARPLEAEARRFVSEVASLAMGSVPLITASPPAS